MLFGATDPSVHVLPNCFPLPPFAVGAHLFELHLRMLAVVSTDPGVDRCALHRFPLAPFRGRPPSFPHCDSCSFECLRARACPPSRAQVRLCSAVVFMARAVPPRLPRATACGFFTPIILYNA